MYVVYYTFNLIFFIKFNKNIKDSFKNLILTKNKNNDLILLINNFLIAIWSKLPGRYDKDRNDLV